MFKPGYNKQKSCEALRAEKRCTTFCSCEALRAEGKKPVSDGYNYAVQLANVDCYLEFVGGLTAVAPGSPPAALAT